MRASLKTVAVLILLFAATAAEARSIRIVAYGDSATSGWLVKRDEAYPAQLEKALRRRGHDVTVKNAGMPGATLLTALRQFDQAIEPGTDIAIIEFGTNDRRAGASMTTVAARLGDLLRSLRARHIKVLVVGLGSLDLSAIAQINRVAYAQWTLPRSKYRARDGAHFNAAGYAILVARMLPQIEALLAAN